MSLPLSRRIARTALLVAAGAASAVGATGSANATELLPTDKTLGGVSNLDGAHLGDTIDDTSRGTGNQIARTGGKAVQDIVPAAGKTVGSAGKTAVPAVEKTAGDAVGTAGSLVGETAKPAAGKIAKGKATKGKAAKGKGKLPLAKDLTKPAGSLTDSLPAADKLPVKGLPLI
ncbi:ATP-binding protein [Streptomyces sp. TRM43335]|uniref:ATP-binding protein n=1 Tax=Streptomyces taklimakanensis TaxID=2569853 RepID=A0A6G2BEZ5_9ACTN|nr:ATP-binding protein [Streptomyces taklimakanensis]MTE20851.1 ATP-binding protein [Streptomyces taklimakanensis]